MNIVDMHLYFRELAQQAGMQTVRAILPEDIDINLNMAIDAKVKRIIRENAGNVSNTKIAHDNAKISQLNSLRSLYKKANASGSGQGSQTNPYTCRISSNDVLLFTGFKSVVDSRVYDVRIIEIEELGETLNDFCNRAEYNAPLCTVTGDVSGITIDVYTGYRQGHPPTSILYTYIKVPDTVCHPDVGRQVDSDIVEYLHKDVVKDAVDIYLKAIVATNASN